MAKKKPKGVTQHTFQRIYDRFSAPISKFDCGQHCSPLNGGSPVCCSTEHAVPVAHKVEWHLLKERSDLWHTFKPYDAATRQIVNELAHDCCAIECKGPRFCERDNRTLACRAFPFFPYITRDDQTLGLSVYWIYEDRCWVISNLAKVDTLFVNQCLDAFAILFAADREEYETYREQSASMRRVFTRWKRPIPILTREGTALNVLPGGKGTRATKAAAFPKLGAYASAAAYREAIADAEAAAEAVRARSQKLEVV